MNETPSIGDGKVKIVVFLYFVCLLAFQISFLNKITSLRMKLEVVRGVSNEWVTGSLEMKRSKVIGNVETPIETPML